VLVLIKCLGYGGAERLLVDMMSHRSSSQFDYEVAYILTAESTLVPQVQASGVLVHDLGAKGNTDLSWLRRLRALLADGRYDIVHFHLPYAATLGRLVAATLPRGRRPALVYTEHNMWDKMAVALRVLNRATIALDDRLLVVSEAARCSLPRTLRLRAQVVIHGIDLSGVSSATARRAEHRSAVREELAIPEGELLVLTVANLRREKGYDVLLRAARRVADREVPVRFAAVGRGPLADQLAEQHASLELGDRFRFLGQRTDVLRLLAAADIFVLPSRQEGLPVALMEAACMGVPVVVTAVGEHPRLLVDRTNAMVVPSEDPDALADAVAEVANNADLRARLAAGSLARGVLFDVSRCVRDVETVYRELCRHRSGVTR
jgi:glycosyltransferase involved in cell wall biosynthesis